jgi:hypothetical protein
MHFLALLLYGFYFFMILFLCKNGVKKWRLVTIVFLGLIGSVEYSFACALGNARKSDFSHAPLWVIAGPDDRFVPDGYTSVYSWLGGGCSWSDLYVNSLLLSSLCIISFLCVGYLFYKKVKKFLKIN